MRHEDDRWRPDTSPSSCGSRKSWRNDVDVAELPNADHLGFDHLAWTASLFSTGTLTSNDTERSDFLQSVLRWTLSILSEIKIDKGFFSN